jgi:hypothetical protein
MKKNIIKHESSLEEYPDILVPAKTKIPDWYKKEYWIKKQYE